MENSFNKKKTHCLSWDIAQSIKIEKDSASLKQLSYKYNVSIASIWNAIHDKTYKTKPRSPEELKEFRRYMKTDGRLKSQYGINIEQLHKMTEAQNNKCAICGRHPSEDSHRWGKLCIDHCHKTGKTRELLCSRCNTTIGKVGESVELLKKMIDYLEKHGKKF